MKTLILFLLLFNLNDKPIRTAQEVNIERCAEDGQIRLDMGEYDLIIPIRMVDCKI